MSNSKKTNRRTAENEQSIATTRTTETINSNTPGGSPGEELILPSLLDADPDLADEAQAMVDEEERPQVGRPRIDRADLTEKCYYGLFVNDHDNCILRHCRSGWYHYIDGRYVLVQEEEIDKKITGYLVRIGEDALSTALRRDILGILKSDEFCGLDGSKYEMPCFLSTGEKAVNFIAMKNGIINVDELLAAMKAGTSLPPPMPLTPDFFSSFRLNYEFDPTARAPKFMKYLEEVQPNEENREMLQMIAGLLLIPDTSYNVAFFLVGQAGTGKSVFVNVLEALVGSENCCCVPLANFASRFDNVGLTEALANIVGDMPVTPESGRLADMEGVFKKVTSGETLFVQRKYMNGREAKVTARCVFATNGMPHFSDRSNGVWDRVRVTPFKVVFRNTDKQNPHLFEELCGELPGIFNWALEGLCKLREQKIFPQCEEGRMVLEQLREDCDHERTFLRETVKEDKHGKVESQALYQSYRVWCQNNGYSPVGANNFKNAILREFPGVTSNRRFNEYRQKVTVIQGIAYS
jgi:P4 family phage/plasmid primase-like protien